MAEWLSDEWAKEVGALSDLLPAVPGLSGTVSLAVTGPARRQVVVHWRYIDGAPSEGPPAEGPAAAAPDADLALLLASPDAVEVLSGAVEPSVAFMRGRMKASGDGALLLGFLASTNGPEFDAWRQRVGELAEETSAPKT